MDPLDGLHPIVRYARASQAAYLAQLAGYDAVEALGLEIVGDALTGDDSLAFAARDDQVLVLCYRGTADLADILADGEVIAVGQPAVHGGFLARWQAMAAWTRSMLVKHQSARVIFTGHSLGGAIATLAAFNEAKGPAECWTYGCPRVGLDRFCTQYQAIPHLLTTRVVHHDDIVPTLPAFFDHVGPALRLTDEGKVISQLRGWIADLVADDEQALADVDGQALADHGISKYIAACEAYAASLVPASKGML